MHTLTHPRNHRGSQIVGLLTFIGVPARMLRTRGGGQSFWRRRIDFLAVLETARNQFRERIKRLHIAGQFCAGAVKLISAWNTVRERFREHGHELA